MIAADLLLPSAPRSVQQSEVDPLVLEGGFLEAQVLDVWIDASRGVVGILLELRTALHLHETNAGVLVATGVEDVQWSTEVRSPRHYALNVVDSVVRQEPTAITTEIGCYVSARLSLRSQSLAYFNCQIQGIGEGPPDYIDNDLAAIQANVPRWQSIVEVVSGSMRSVG